MKDPTIPDPKTRKKFMFYDTEKRQIDLRIQLRTEKMNQSMFFRAMITGYLEKDPDLMNYIYRFKETNSIQSEQHRRTIERQTSQAQEIKSQFGLDKGDIEKFFDIMEEEHPNL